MQCIFCLLQQGVCAADGRWHVEFIFLRRPFFDRKLTGAWSTGEDPDFIKQFLGSCGEKRAEKGEVTG